MSCRLWAVSFPQDVSFPKAEGFTHILTGVDMRFYLGGGIGSGKSAAGACFRSFGAVVVSGDDAGREVLAPGTVEAAAVLRRWPEAKAPDGTIDRPALGRIVFADRLQLSELEAITAPGIRARLLSAAAAHPHAIVLVEVPVLREFAGTDWPWIVVDAPEELRVTRAVQRGSGMSAADVRHVIDRQPGRGDWLAAAAWVIDNSGDLAHLERQCRLVWDEIHRP